MSTATEPTAEDANTVETAGYVDFDEFIEFQIRKTRSGIKSNDLLTALIGGAAAVLAYVLVFALFDHWVVEGGFGRTTRMVLLSVLVSGLTGWCVWKLVLPYFRKVSPLYAAQQIEETQPDLQNSLMTLVDLKQSGRPVPAAIESALEKRTAVNLSHMNVDEAVDRRLLMRLSYVLFALVVLTCGYVLFSPKKLSNSLWRALLPASNLAVATRTHIENVQPGDVDVLARSQVEVTVDLSGEVPDAVTLLYSTADRRFVDEPVTMRESESGLWQFRGVITGENGAGILQNLTYHVVAGDAASEEYAITVTQPPSATVREVTYEFPDYMGFSDRMQTGGAIDSWEGVYVTLRATANMPVSGAVVMFSDTDDLSQRAEEIPASIENGTEITARWRLKFRSDGTHPAFYRIQCRNEAGETDPAPSLYSIKIKADERPAIQLVQPLSDIDRPANATVPLLFAASDKDFLLRSVILYLELNGDPLPQQPRLYQGPPFRKAIHDTYRLELEPLTLKPGDRLTYWLEARDNMEPFADRSGNRTNSPKLNITITEPASPDEVQQQLEQDEQQIADRLDEARRAANENPEEPRSVDPTMNEGTPPPSPNGDQPPPSDDPSSEQPTGQEQPSEQAEPQDGQRGGEQGGPSEGAGGDSSQMQQGDGQSPESQSGEQPSSPSQPSPDSQQPSKGDDPSLSPRGDDPAFDDLLERMMQRERERQEPQPQQPRQGNEQQPNEPSQSQDGQQPPQPGEQPSSMEPGEPAQPGANGQSSDSPSRQNTSGQPSDQAGNSGDQSPSPSNEQSPGEGTTGEQTPGSQPEMNDAQKSGSGDRPGESQPGGTNEDGIPEENGTSKGGQPMKDEQSPESTDGRPTGESTDGGQKQPGNDPTGAKPGDGNTDSVNPKPANPNGTDPKMNDQPGPKPGKPTQNPDAKSGGQPNGPDEPMQGAGDPQGQKSDQPQTGEGGNSQQASQGNKGSDQTGAGDPTGKKGEQQPADAQTGQPGSKSQGEGSQQQTGGKQPSGEKPGAKGTESDSSSGPQKGSPAGGESKPGEGGGDEPAGQPGGPQSEGEQPRMTPDGGNQDQQQPPGQEGQPDPQGAEKPQGDQPGGKPQGGSEPSGPTPGSKGTPGGEGQGGSQSPGSGNNPLNPDGELPEGQKGGSGTGQPMSPDAPDAPPQGVGEGGEDDPNQPGDAGTGDDSASNITPEEADLAAKKKAANLVLEDLQNQLQRGEIDPELQKDLGVTPEQLRKFSQRLEERLAEISGDDRSPEAQARRRQFEETLRTIDYGSKGATREGGDGPREATGGFAGPRRPAPPQHRDAAREYRQRLLKRASSSR